MEDEYSRTNLTLSRMIKEIIVIIKYNLRINKSLLTLRVLNYYLNTFLKKKPLLSVEIAIDFKCNLKCAHCSTERLVKPQDCRKLSISDYKRLGQECLGLGVRELIFGGGEPLLFPYLEEVIYSVQPHKFLIAILTNGTLLNRDRILRLKKIGVDRLVISLDSFIPEEHDNSRGAQGTFAKAFEALNLALNNGMSVTINTIVTHQNLKSPGMLELIDFAIKKKILLHMILAAPVGRWSNHWDGLITEEDTKFIDYLNKKNPYIKGDIHFSGLFKHCCPAVKRGLYITPYGDVLPCAFLHFSLGNILQEPLAKIRNRGLNLKIFSKHPSKCLAAEDRDFLRQYQSIISDKERLPLDFRDIFKYRRLDKNI